jgi:hypothetical protein
MIKPSPREKEFARETENPKLKMALLWFVDLEIFALNNKVFIDAFSTIRGPRYLYHVKDCVVLWTHDPDVLSV